MSRLGKLPELEAYLLSQFVHIDDGAAVVDAEQRIVLWNEAATVLLGYRSEEILGKRCSEVIKTRDCGGAETCSQNVPLINDSGNDQLEGHHTLLVETKTGKTICLHVAGYPLFSPDRKLLGVAHIFWEVTNAADAATEDVDALHPPPFNSMEISPLLLLTPQEKNVLSCLATGMDGKKIAVALSISPKTVRNHAENILRKLGVHSRLEAVAQQHHLT